MAFLERDQFLARINERVGEDSSDEAINFVMDMTDTYNELMNRAENADNEDWHQRYIQNDESWRKKFSARFFNGPINPRSSYQPVDEPDDDEYNPDSIIMDDLFK